VLPADDPKFQVLAAQAMEIYWRDTIDIPIIQWLHRIPYNQTYWTNWPTQTNLAIGHHGEYWAQTGTLGNYESEAGAVERGGRREWREIKELACNRLTAGSKANCGAACMRI